MAQKTSNYFWNNINSLQGFDLIFTFKAKFVLGFQAAFGGKYPEKILPGPY